MVGSHMKDVPISKLLSGAIESAKQGLLSEAAQLLRAAEHRANESPVSDSAKKLISSVRAKFALLEHEPAFVNSDKQVLLGAGVDDPLPGVSIVTCSKNRTENLIKAMKTWLPHKDVRQIVVVDWCSDRPVASDLMNAGIEDERILVVRVEDEPRWILSYAFNAGFRVAQHERVLKVDADITLEADFFSKNILRPGSFIAGDWQKANKGQEFINGFFFACLKDIQRIRGFNEYITTYGWDDDDIYMRLQSLGLQRKCVDVSTIYHLPHDDHARIGKIEKSPMNAMEQLESDTLFKIRANRYLANVMPLWDFNRIFAPFVVVGAEKQYLSLLRKKNEMSHYVSADIRADAEYYARAELVSWRLGPTVYHINRTRLEQLLKLKRLEELSLFDMDLAVEGGKIFESLRRNVVVLQICGSDVFGKFRDLVCYLNSTIARDDTAVFIRGPNWEFVKDQLMELKLPWGVLGDWIRTDDFPELTLDRLSVEVRDRSKILACRVSIAANTAIPRPARSKSRSKRKFYVDVQHGLGNRLRALASAAAIAKATDRELQVVWVPDSHCECSLSDIFDFEGDVIDDYGDLPEDVKRYNYMEIEEGAKKDELINSDERRDILVRSAFVLNHTASNWETENEELRRLRPSRDVLSLVESSEVPRNAIGAHVRMEAGAGKDHNSYDSALNWCEESHKLIHFWRSKSHYSAFMSKIDALLKEDDARKIFLATDLAENYDIFRKVYGERLLYLERQSFDRSKEQIAFALADAILLSRSSHFLGSTWSSFSELALRMSSSIAVVEMSGKDF
jgi:glycosyltransferase involved in cell wall biosynthesis